MRRKNKVATTKTEFINIPEQQIVCDFCDPETSQPAFVTLGKNSPMFYTRELKDADDDGLRICSFSDVSSRRIGAWLAKQAMRFWPNGTLLVEDVQAKSFWILRLAETDSELAFEECAQTLCCGRYVIGAETFPWQYDELFDLEIASRVEPW